MGNILHFIKSKMPLSTRLPVSATQSEELTSSLTIIQYCFQLEFLFSTYCQSHLRLIYTQTFMIYHSDIHNRKVQLRAQETIHVFLAKASESL